VEAKFVKFYECQQRFQIRTSGVAFPAFANWRRARPISATCPLPIVIFRTS